MESRFYESLESTELTSLQASSSHGVPVQTIHQRDSPQHEATPKSVSKSVVSEARIDPVLPDLYAPFWLRTGSLLGLSLLFTLLLISLIIVWRVVVSHDGLPLTLTSNHYVWKYGPTALLIIVLGLWRQVDYYCKLTQPWRQLRTGYTEPQLGILLDYVSPMQVISLYRSFRQRHAPVALSIAGFLLLKFIILVSTALFTLEPTTTSASVDIDYVNAFDSSKMWSAVGLPYSGNLGMTEYSAYTEVGTDSVWSCLNELNGQPEDVSRVKDGIVFQSFALPESSQNITSLSCTVYVFIPNITCEPATVGMLPDSTSLSYLTFDTATCSVGHHQALAVSSEQQLLGMYRVNCSDTGNETTYVYDPGEDIASSHFDYRYVVSIANFEETTTDPSDGPSYNLTRANAAMCKIDYSIWKANLTQDLLTGSVSLQTLPDELNNILPNLTSLQLSELVFASIVETKGALQVNLDLNQMFLSGGQTMFQLISALLGPDTKLEAFYDQNRLVQSVATVLEGITIQFGRLRLLQPTQEYTEGHALIGHNKLMTRVAALVMMTVGLVFMILLSAVTAFEVRKKVVPQKPGTIAAHACVLARSQSFARKLKVTGQLRTSELKRKLHDTDFMVEQTEQGYCIEATDVAQHSTKLKKTKEDAWIPLAVQLPMLVVLLLLSLLAIALLEVLHQISNKNDGVIDVSVGISGTTISYIVVYGSTLAALLITTLFNNLDFTIATFTPYSALRSGRASADRSLLLNILGDLPPVALFRSVQTRQFGASMSLLAATIGSFLTVVVSGLWITDYQVMTSTTVTRELSHTWNLTWANNSYSDDGAAMFLNIFDHGGTGDPVGIWGDYVLPFIGNKTSDKSVQILNNNFNEARYELEVHALEPELSCTSVEEEDTSYGGDGSPYFFVNTQLPDNCRSESSGNSTISFSWNSGIGSTGDRLLGTIMDLNVVAESSTQPQSADSAGCPSLAVVFGPYRGYSVLLCSHRVRGVPLIVSYNGDPSSNTIDLRKPPALDTAQSPRYLLNPVTNQTTFFYKIQQHLVRDNLKTIDPKPLWDAFFDHLINGPYNVTSESIAGQENTEALKVAVNKIYKKYMGQVINLNFRVPMEDVTGAGTAIDGNRDEPAIVNGTRIQQSARLKINVASKFALQIMLSVMLVLDAAALLLVKVRKTLPRSPHSIASVMGFLANSNMCDSDKGILPSGSEFWDEKELKRAFRGRQFSLGWWTSNKNNGVAAIDEGEEEVVEETPIQRDVAIEASGAERYSIDVEGPMTVCETRRQARNPFRPKTGDRINCEGRS